MEVKCKSHIEHKFCAIEVKKRQLLYVTLRVSGFDNRKFSNFFYKFLTEHFSSRWLLIVLHFTQFFCYFYKFLFKGLISTTMETQTQMKSGANVSLHCTQSSSCCSKSSKIKLRKFHWSSLWFLSYISLNIVPNRD